MAEVIVSKWGNSLALRIPKSHAKQCNISAGQTVETTVEGNSITIRPKYTLEQMMQEMTPENRHEEQGDISCEMEQW